MKSKMRSAVAAVLLAATPALITACASTPGKESTGEYIDDSVITTKVKAAFVEDKMVDAGDISVETYKGIVQLSGFAKSDAQRSQAVEIAAKVKGVKSVKNDIRIKS